MNPFLSNSSFFPHPSPLPLLPIFAQSFVPLHQRSENEKSGSNRFEITMEIAEFWLSGSLRSLSLHHDGMLWRMPEMVAPGPLVYRPLPVQISEWPPTADAVLLSPRHQTTTQCITYGLHLPNGIELSYLLYYFPYRLVSFVVF